jgi:hypothetical protein
MNGDFYQCACTSSEERGTFLENVKELNKKDLYIGQPKSETISCKNTDSIITKAS